MGDAHASHQRGLARGGVWPVGGKAWLACLGDLGADDNLLGVMPTDRVSSTAAQASVSLRGLTSTSQRAPQRAPGARLVSPASRACPPGHTSPAGLLAHAQGHQGSLSRPRGRSSTHSRSHGSPGSRPRGSTALSLAWLASTFARRKCAWPGAARACQQPCPRRATRLASQPLWPCASCACRLRVHGPASVGDQPRLRKTAVRPVPLPPGLNVSSGPTGPGIRRASTLR